MKRNRPLNQEKREAILKAAIEEFYSKGFEGSSMDTISKEANVSKATVYNHFKNKEELFLAIASIIQERLKESFQYEYIAQNDIEEQLKDIAKKEMDFLSSQENIKLIQIMTIVMIQKNDIGLKLLEVAKDDCMIMTSQWFEEAKKDGKLEFDSAAFVSRQFIGMIKSFAFFPQLYGAPTLGKDEEKEVIEKSIQMVKALYFKR
jgi:TetR/AcrR family transcriptional regulator of autoinduction and epiphytic fitness